jgi:hypothetical protein
MESKWTAWKSIEPRKHGAKHSDQALSANVSVQSDAEHAARWITRIAFSRALGELVIKSRR